MNTPIIDFIKKYNKNKSIRLHMPGHKGNLRGTAFDITEIDGADSLFDANSIIDESEKNLSSLFNTNFSVYSTQGSSLCIMTMLALFVSNAEKGNLLPGLVIATSSCITNIILIFEKSK